MSGNIEVIQTVNEGTITATQDTCSITLQPVIVKSSENGGAVDSVNGKTGDVVLDKNDIGLGEVDNTSDLDKPISNSTQSALDEKANTDDFKTVGGESIIGIGDIPVGSSLPPASTNIDFTGELLLDNIVGTFYKEYDLEVNGSITFSEGVDSVLGAADYVLIYSDGITPIATLDNLYTFNEQIGIPEDRILPQGTYPVYFWKKPDGLAISVSNRLSFPSTDVDLNAELGSKLLVWLKDATDTSNLVDDGIKASVWINSSDTFINNATQITGTKQPLLDAKGLLFDGADDNLRLTGMALNNFELFFLFEEVSFTANHRVLDFEGTSRFMISQLYDGGENKIQMYSYINASSERTTLSDTGTTRLMTAVSNGSSSEFNGVEFDLGGTASINEMIIANRDSESSGGNLIFKSIIITELLTTSERAKVLEYMDYINE